MYENRMVFKSFQITQLVTSNVAKVFTSESNTFNFTEQGVCAFQSIYTYNVFYHLCCQANATEWLEYVRS